MSQPFDDVQRIVLSGGRWQVARHLVVSVAGGPKLLLHFLNSLIEHWPPPVPVSRQNRRCK